MIAGHRFQKLNYISSLAGGGAGAGGRGVLEMILMMQIDTIYNGNIHCFPAQLLWGYTKSLS